LGNFEGFQSRGKIRAQPKNRCSFCYPREQLLFASKTSIGNFAIASPDELLIRTPHANLEFEGALDEISRCGSDGIPLCDAFALPSGPIESNSLSQLVGLVRDCLNQQTSLAGLVLCLHGAMLDEDGNSADLAILRMARECLGDSMPIVPTPAAAKYNASLFRSNNPLQRGQLNPPTINNLLSEQNLSRAR
jgi:hypothetical protein